MAKAIAARIQGDDYQARFFWLQICRLFQTHTKVVQVGYELNDFKSIDDVVVIYSPAISDGRGGLTSNDYFQIKFHVTQNGVITCQSLIDPKFIGATSFSFLQNVMNAHGKNKTKKINCRFILVSRPRNSLTKSLELFQD